MKKILTLALAFSCGAALAQKADNVGIGTSKPDPSAILDLNSNSKGLLLPRMSEAQRNAIKNPAAGLIIFQTDQVVGTYTFDGSAWQPSNARTSATNSPGAWMLQGSSIDATDFIGTTAASPVKSLIFKTDGVISGLIDPINLNLGLGYQALLNVTTANNNTAIGAGALKTISNAGGGNLAIGADAMGASGAAVQNVAIGEAALQNNISGLRNTAIGRGALQNSGSSQYNVALGFEAGRDATTSNNVYIGTYAGIFNTQSNKLFIHSNTTPTTTPLIGGDFVANTLKFHTGTTAPTATAGFVAIGDFSAAGSTSTPGAGGINSFPAFTAGSQYRLIVQDGILTEKLKVALRNGAEWADYVFAPDYKLMPLENVESFIKTNKHLPNVPSADEMAKSGLDVVQTSAKLMEKIEELTLYLIDLKKEVENIKQENKILKEKLK